MLLPTKSNVKKKKKTYLYRLLLLVPKLYYRWKKVFCWLLGGGDFLLHIQISVYCWERIEWKKFHFQTERVLCSFPLCVFIWASASLWPADCVMSALHHKLKVQAGTSAHAVTVTKSHASAPEGSGHSADISDNKCWQTVFVSTSLSLDFAFRQRSEGPGGAANDVIQEWPKRNHLLHFFSSSIFRKAHLGLWLNSVFGVIWWTVCRHKNNDCALICWQNYTLILFRAVSVFILKLKHLQLMSFFSTVGFCWGSSWWFSFYPFILLSVR